MARITKNFRLRPPQSEIVPINLPTEIKAGATPVVAIRLFCLDDNTMDLTSLNKGERWKPGEIKRSRCARAMAHGHLRPEAACSCGIWSCRSRRALTRAFPDLVARFLPNNRTNPWLIEDEEDGYRWPLYFSAQVQQWGRVIEHEDGYRSEYARIIPETIQVWPRPKEIRKHRKIITFLRNRYAAA